MTMFRGSQILTNTIVVLGQVLLFMCMLVFLHSVKLLRNISIRTSINYIFRKNMSMTYFSNVYVPFTSTITQMSYGSIKVRRLENFLFKHGVSNQISHCMQHVVPSHTEMQEYCTTLYTQHTQPATVITPITSTPLWL